MVDYIPSLSESAHWTGSAWEEYIWKYLQSNPNTTSRTLEEKVPGLTRGAASGFLSKLAKRGQIAAVKFLDVGTGKDTLHYSIACKEFVPLLRTRNKRTKPPLPSFDFSQEDKPIALIHNTVNIERREPVRFNPEAFVESLSLPQGRELYDYLHNIYGPRK